MIKNNFYQILVVCLIFIVCVGCTKKDESCLSVAVSASTPPYSFYDTDNNSLVGFDIDIANEIARRLNKKINYQTYDFDRIIYAVMAGKVDFGMESMYISDEREKIMNFTIPYNYDETKIAVKDSFKDINTIEDLRKTNISVAMRNGTVYPSLLEDWGFNSSRMIMYPTQTDLNIAMMNGTVEAVASGYKRLDYQRKHMNLKIKFLEPSIVAYQASGITVNKNNPEMLDQLNKTLNDMIEDKTYDKIAKKWMGSNPLEDYEKAIKK